MFEPKILAFYLPQFHEIEENNAWWGEGFTEWTNVKAARPVYKGQYQPKVPYNKNYYDLSNPKVLDEQARLANKYGVDGFCFYHYWFTGKKLLEKPVEILLNHPEINMKYCLSWANETWSRRWTGEEKEILIQQNYGEMEDWENHFQYLLNFFKDSRYIQIEGKPVLLLYRAYDIKQGDKMLTYWNNRMKEEGMSGLYIVETLNSRQREGCLESSSAYVEFEPMYTIHQNSGFGTRIYRYLYNHLKLSNIGFRIFFSYDIIWKKILMRNLYYNKKVFLGAFPGWDNTARRGKEAWIVKGNTPQKFKDYLMKQYRRSIENKNELIFINAWNEWGEGAYLEADEKYGFSYLKAIKSVKESI